jgi:hypothetical protein
VFADLANQINNLQRQVQSGGEPIHRAVFVKSHACMRAELHVFDNTDHPERAIGVFATPKTFPAWLRIASGASTSKPDLNPDLRGAAIKLVGVEGTKILPDEATAKTQDFIFRSAADTPMCDLPTFVAFVKATVDPLALSQFLLGHPKVALYLAKHLPIFKSLAAQQFWSTTPYKLGDRAVKYTLIPTACEGSASADDSPILDGLTLAVDFNDRLATGDVCYNFAVQFQADPLLTPVEDPSVEWDTDLSPFVAVAQLVVHQPDPARDPDAAQRESDFCNSLSWNPWHALPEHRPLGAFNRGRKFLYQASAKLRGSTPEPDGTEQF